MSAHEHESHISREDVEGRNEGPLPEGVGDDRPDSDEDRGEGLGDESGLVKASGSEGIEELQAAADERNERGFVSFDDEQAELLLEEDRAGSLPNPREPEHEAERKAKLAAEDEAVQERAAEQSLEVDDDGISK